MSQSKLHLLHRHHLKLACPFSKRKKRNINNLEDTTYIWKPQYPGSKLLCSRDNDGINVIVIVRFSTEGSYTLLWPVETPVQRAWYTYLTTPETHGYPRWREWGLWKSRGWKMETRVIGFLFLEIVYFRCEIIQKLWSVRRKELQRAIKIMEWKPNAVNRYGFWLRQHQALSRKSRSSCPCRQSPGLES